jgi:hypothetical protein
VRVPVSRSGCTDTGKCSIRHLSRASGRRCRYRADGPVPLGASILKETPIFPLVFETLKVELRDHKVLLRSAAMANDIPARIDDKAFAEIEGLGGPTLVLAHTICRGNEHYVFHGARAQEQFPARMSALCGRHWHEKELCPIQGGAARRLR